MRSFATAVVFTGLYVAGNVNVLAQDESSVSATSGVLALTSLIPPSPTSGFYHPYILKLPTEWKGDGRTWLLVETNNSGVATDDLDVHLAAARRATEQGVGAYAANQLSLPMLVPAFPRPGGDRHNVYTHALDRDSIEVHSGSLQRLDLQLLAMIDDAIERIGTAGFDVSERVLMVGFSASATFANRFSMIHPSRVAAVAIGGFNGILMLPMQSIDGTELQYPLGVSDYETLFGNPFDRTTWLAIPQFAFMGANDSNDAVSFNDAYSEDERVRIRALMGKTMLPDRWNFVQQKYEESGADMRTATYPGIGHGTNRQINSDMAEFLANATNQ